MLEKLKNLFRSKKKKLILDIKKKHKKNITDNDITDYRRKHRKQSDSISDNDILMLILSEDSERPISSNYSDFYTNNESTSNYSSPHVTTREYSNSYKSPKSTRDDDNCNGLSDYNSGSYECGSGSGSSSSDCGSSSSCD